MLSRFQRSIELKRFFKVYFYTLLAFTIPVSIQFYFVYEDIQPKLFITPFVVANIFGFLLGWNSVLRYRLEYQSRAKNDLISSVSHEIRNPLTVINGYSSILLSSSDLSEKDKACIENLQKSGEHILGIITDLLDVSYVEAGRINIDAHENLLNDIYRHATTSFKEQLADKGMKIEILPFDENIKVLADPVRLQQIIDNYISNAIKYGNKNSTIKIQTAVKNDHVRVSVIDKGPGIPAEKLSQLFIPFSRLGAEKTGVKGTGIGLALCKRLVEVQNGKVGVKSVIDNGTEFWFELPLCP